MLPISVKCESPEEIEIAVKAEHIEALGGSFSRRARMSLAACAAMSLCAVAPCSLGTEAAFGSGPHAHVAKLEKVKEYLRLEITSTKGNVITAVGAATGNIVAHASMSLDLVNVSHAIAVIHASNSHGAISGVGDAIYSASGAISRFHGSKLPTMKGTGKYKDLRAVSIKMTGEMNRRTLKIWVNLEGVWDA